MQPIGIESLDRILRQVESTTSTLKTKGSQLKTEPGQKENLYKCSSCKDTGYIITKKENRQPLITPCKCVEADKVKKLWRNSGINTDDLEKSFKNFETWSTKSIEMKDIATNYFLRFDKIKDDRINSILLCGNPGGGKTHIALALANNLLKKDIRVVYMPYRDVITSLKQNMLDEE